VINGMHATEARIGLLPTPEGGLIAPMPSRSRSLLLMFPSLEEPEGKLTIGATIETADGAPLEPGSEGVAVQLGFWADEAQVYATPGARFDLYYAGRTVGRGEVTRLLDEVTDAAG
jgi:hypothetical protein